MICCSYSFFSFLFCLIAAPGIFNFNLYFILFERFAFFVIDLVIIPGLNGVSELIYNFGVLHILSLSYYRMIYTFFKNNFIPLDAYLLATQTIKTKIL